MIEVVRRGGKRKRRRLRAPRLSLKPLRVSLAALLVASLLATAMGAVGLYACLGHFGCQDWLLARWR